MKLDDSHASFDITRWTLVQGLRRGDHEASNVLMERYWPAVYAHLRAKGLSRHAAAELTQAFFCEVVLGRRLFERADREVGRLRSLVLSALKRFMIDTHRRESVRGKGRNLPIEALEFEDQRISGSVGLTADEAFDKRWALAVLHESLERCEQQLCEANLRKHWLLFEARHLVPVISGNDAPVLGAIAAEFGFNSPAAAAAATQVAKHRFTKIMEQVVSETMEDPTRTMDEMRALRRVLGV